MSVVNTAVLRPTPWKGASPWQHDHPLPSFVEPVRKQQRQHKLCFFFAEFSLLLITTMGRSKQIQGISPTNGIQANSTIAGVNFCVGSLNNFRPERENPRTNVSLAFVWGSAVDYRHNTANGTNTKT